MSRSGLAASNFSRGKGLCRLWAADAEEFARNCGGTRTIYAQFAFRACKFQGEGSETSWKS
ncbi:hypothetical protein CUJ84_pRLN1000055 (plasmid) [Rhizobium leguminosarum]|uniref:Uncharacterized protein n=1 Tax=Rhizobium leguminosarum TaxID=384 RepID=A0A2K9ZBA8_RHILE|nr:hypothetical protein CUJ84_pRLN1000055 [Rhizobium leguminosarum]